MRYNFILLYGWPPQYYVYLEIKVPLRLNSKELQRNHVNADTWLSRSLWPGSNEDPNSQVPPKVIITNRNML